MSSVQTITSPTILGATGTNPATPSADDDPSIPIAPFEGMALRWQVVSDLLGGTPGMRASRERNLPKWPKELDDDYNARLASSFLYPMFEDTVDSVVSKPFSRPVTLDFGEEEAEEGAEVSVHPMIGAIEDDADVEGNSFHVFLRRVFREAVAYGKAHILVDFPASDADRTADEEVHPYFVLVRASELIGWKYGKIERGGKKVGKPVLLEARIKRTQTRPRGEYGDEVYEEVLVYRRDEWILFEKGEGDSKFVEVSRGPNPLGEVPLVEVNLNPIAAFIATPPLESLGWLNVRHWQSTSDQNNILHFVRMAILTFSGVEKKELGGEPGPDGTVEPEFALGANRYLRFQAPAARAAFVEIQGGSIQAGERDIQRLREEGETLGAQPFLRGAGKTTATQHVISDERAETDVGAWVDVLAKAAEFAYWYAAKWVEKVVPGAGSIDKILPETFKVSIFKDFGFSARAQWELEFLFKLLGIGAISPERILREARRRNLFGEDFDLLVELEKAEEGKESIFGSLLGGMKDSDEEEESEDDEGPNEGGGGGSPTESTDDGGSGAAA